MKDRKAATVVALGFAQIIAWGSTYYLPAVLAPAMAAELRCTTPTIFAAFSFALILSAVVGPAFGRAIDRLGGKPVLVVTNLIFACGLGLLGWADSVTGLFLAWSVIGLGMGGGLYDGAFATVVRLYGREGRNAITGITLIAGFASTVGWPLSHWLLGLYGWRTTCFAWVACHLLLAMPLNLSLPKAGDALHPALPTDSTSPATEEAVGAHALRNTVLLAWIFAVTWSIAAAMAAHFPTFLRSAGADTEAALVAGMLVGPAQVAGRLLEFGLLRRISPLLSARLAGLMHPVGALLLITLGAGASYPFALLHGAGNGILTIAKGTLPLLFFGPRGYGARQGWLMMPARISQALAPFLFGLLLARVGIQSAWVSCGLGLTVFLALLALRRP